MTQPETWSTEQLMEQRPTANLGSRADGDKDRDGSTRIELPEGDVEDLYPGGFPALVERFDRKRRPLYGSDDYLPPADVDLTVLREALVEPPEASHVAARKNSVARKHLELQPEFEGQSALLLLHAMVIAMTRRSEFPDRTMLLFLRLWTEQGEFLATTLPVRWLISAATTFADHGVTPEQRACGMGLSVMFDMMKLHDSERRLTGRAGNEPFRLSRKSRQADSLAFGMPGYSFRNGDLDCNMLARLWKLTEADSTIAPLGMAMLKLVMADRSTIFGRVQVLKGLHAKANEA